MCCWNFCFCGVFQIISNGLHSLIEIIRLTHYSDFCKSLSEFYIALVGVVGILAVYRIQFFENNIKACKEILIRYVSVLKEDKAKDHDTEWYSYLDDAELEALIKDNEIPKHQRDFGYHKQGLQEILAEYSKKFENQEDKSVFLDELKRVWAIVDNGNGLAKAYKNLSFNSPSVQGIDIQSIHKHVHGIRMSSSKIDAFQRRMAYWTQAKRTWEHFKQTCYRFLRALIGLFTFFFIIKLFSPLSNILPSKCILYFKGMLWLIGFVSILGASFYLRKFIFICLEKEKEIKFDGILP